MLARLLNGICQCRIAFSRLKALACVCHPLVRVSLLISGRWGIPSVFGCNLFVPGKHKPFGGLLSVRFRVEIVKVRKRQLRSQFLVQVPGIFAALRPQEMFFVINLCLRLTGEEAAYLPFLAIRFSVTQGP